MGFLRATNTTVSILHNSAKEYLFDENRKDNLPVLSKTVADLIIAWECFRYLHHVFGDPERFPSSEVWGGYRRYQDSSLGRDPLGEEQQETPWEVARKAPQEAAVKWPYLRYAAESWFVHARQGFKISKVKHYDFPASGWLMHEFFHVSDTIRKPWIELCGDPQMEILAGDQDEVHIVACLGPTPLVQSALPFSPINTMQLLWLISLNGMSLKYCIPFSKCTPSLLMKMDENGNTLPKTDARELRPVVYHLGYKKELNRKNHLDDTPLHLAFQFDHLDIVKVLLKEGVDTTIKNDAQLTASELGAQLGRGYYILEKTRKGAAVIPVEGPGRRL